MFSHAPKFDAIDQKIHRNLDRWVVLQWVNGLFNPPKGIPFGTHLATLIHCHPGEEIKGLNICWLVQSKEGQFYRACEPLVGIEATWLFRYETLKKFPLIELSQMQVDFLGLGDIESKLALTVTNELRRCRSAAKLNGFRHPGYPDDVSVVLKPDGNNTISEARNLGEHVWIRIKHSVSSNEYRGELLNQPVSINLKMGAEILVRCIGSGENMILQGVRIDSKGDAAATCSTHPLAERKLRDRAEYAPTSLRVIFDSIKQRLQKDYPEIMIAPHWESFVGLATLAGCFCLATSLAHEAPKEMRTELETIMRKQLQLRWPESDGFWDDIARFVTVSLSSLQRTERSGAIYEFSAAWILKQIGAELRTEQEEDVLLQLIEVLSNEAHGYWASIQDYSDN